jgi:hypothetical protein
MDHVSDLSEFARFGSTSPTRAVKPHPDDR